MYGYQLDIPTNLKRNPDPIYTYENYLTELRYKLQLAHTRARENLLISKENNKEKYDLTTKDISYKVGDKILLTNENRKTKLHNPFIGPYEITEIISDTNIRIKYKNKNKIVHVNRTKLFHEQNSNKNPPHNTTTRQFLDE